jgi:hypothetical protein
MIANVINAVTPGGTVTFPVGAHYFVEGTLEVLFRHGVTINVNSSTIQATTNGTLNRAHWRFTRCHDCILNDPVVIGANPAGGTGDSAYNPLYEGQHGIQINGGSNYTINNPTITDIYGDFVYLTDSGGWVDGVVVNNPQCARNGRQGFSIIAARNVHFTGGTLSDIRRSYCDFEPNTSAQGAENVLVDHMTVSNVRLSFLACHGAAGTIDGLTFDHITALGVALRADVFPPGTSRRSNFAITNCTSNLPFGTGGGTGSVSVFTRVDGITVTNNVQPVQGGRSMAMVNVSNCTAYTVTGNSLPPDGIQLRVVSP